MKLSSNDGPGHEIPDVIENQELELLPEGLLPDGRTQSRGGELSRDPEHSEIVLDGSSASDGGLEDELADGTGSEETSEAAEEEASEAAEEEVSEAAEEEVSEAVEEEDDSASSDSTSSACQIEEIEVTGMEGFQVDEWVCEAQALIPAESPEEQVDVPEPSSVTKQDDAEGGPVTAGVAGGLPVDDAAAQEKVTDDMVSVIMDELLNDTIQSSAVSEPALRHPTPIAPSFIDIFSEDSAPDGSSAESESVVQPSPRRPPSQKSETESGVSPKKMPSKAEEIRLAAGGEKASKDAGPPRPPSPPPDLRSTSTESANDSAAPQKSQSSPKGRQETAELISQELLDMMLGEALDEFEDSPGRHKTSPREETRISVPDAGSAPASPLAGPQPIDTSEAVVAPFLDVVFQQLGVTDEDEAQPIVGPLPDVEEWLPAVLEVMKTRHRATRGEDRPKAGPPSRPKEEEDIEPSLEETEVQNVESFTRLLADAFLETANEEVKEQGPRIMGWRRPCFGEAPLSRFRAKQEGTTPSQQQTWEKVREKLTEAVRFGWRNEAGGDELPAGRTLEADASSGGAVTLSNIDEGIDALLEEEICSDEASWLDIKGDVQKVKNQVAGMIFMDLVDEMVTEIGSMWSA
ncbi:unnamed protein product [Symbiodinium natans]|uniref:DUF4378 domain-containing protein n=1 Tax=Symbiodinium natans TaxID=878477 RepID=A0A812S3H3_9DINO|nr:unnamed protein product [Symbiodinium natans]